MSSTLGAQDPSAGGSPVAPSPDITQPDTTSAAAAQPAAQPTSRLGMIIDAVSTALRGIPDRGRPSFVTGLGEGARAEQQEQATQQSIKFRNFDDQVRLAQLHNQDLKMQQDTQAQKDAHVKAELENRSLANSLGIKYDTIANDGKTVMDHLTAQTAANGSASVPAGTHLSGDGGTVNIPQNDQQTQDGQKQMYSMLAPAFGLPQLPQGADFVPPNLMNMLTNKIHGYGIDGKPINHKDLPGAIGALQTQRDQMAKNGTPDTVLKAMDNTLGIYKANLDALDSHATDVQKKSEQAKLDVQNSPENVQAAAKKAAAIASAQQPFKQAEAKFQQTLKDGDPEAAGKMLADGDVAPSQIISTRNPAFAQQAFTAAKKFDSTFNAQTAETHFKAANSPTNLGFFGSAKSLTDPNGTLDQLAEAYKKLPNGQIPKLNKLADWESAAKGEGATAAFAQTALGVADDYAKVMGGGQGSDTAREEMLKGFAMASSPKQMEGAIDAARMAIASQMQSRIGSNKALSRAYGDNIPQRTIYATAPGKPRVMSRDGGKTWQQALAQ